MYNLVTDQNKQYMELLPDMGPLANEVDAINLISLCYENDTYHILLYASNLSPDFFDLHTGVAGKIMLKLSMHGIKVVAIVTPEQIGNSRFAEMAMEGNHFNNFGFFYTKEQALKWLTNK